MIRSIEVISGLKQCTLLQQRCRSLSRVVEYGTNLGTGLELFRFFRFSTAHAFDSCHSMFVHLIFCHSKTRTSSENGSGGRVHVRVDDVVNYILYEIVRIEAIRLKVL